MQFFSERAVKRMLSFDKERTTYQLKMNTG